MKKFFSLLIILVLTLSFYSFRASASSPAEIWPMFRHDLQHTGRSQYDTSGNNGTLKWRYQTGNGVGSPTIGSDGTIYAGSGDHCLYAMNPEGTLKWRYETGDSVGSSPAIGSDGTIYVGSTDCYLYAIKSDGTLKWRYQTGNGISSSPAISSDGTIYVGSHDHYIYALNPDGTLKWRYQTGVDINSSPAIGSDGTIYVGSHDHYIAGQNDRYLYALNPDGNLKWKFRTDERVFSSPAVGSDGTIYVGSQGHYLYAINPNGSLKWKYKAVDLIEPSPAIGSDGTIYFGSHDEYVYALKPDGTLKWRYKTGDNVVSSPAISSDGTIYVGSDDHYLYALNSDGTLKWKYKTDDTIKSSPAIGSDGTIYVGSNDHYLYAIGPLTYTITVNKTGLGIVEKNPDKPLYNSGESVTLTATPSIGYHFVDWKGDVTQGHETDNPLTVTMDVYKTITATFEINTYTITSSAGSGGSISPAGVITVNSGDSKTFNINPNSGYKISNVQIDDVSRGSISTYTFTNITADHTISATFEKQITQTIIILQIGKSNFSVNGVSNTLDSPPIIKNSRTLLPIRAVVEALGGSVGWDATERKVTVSLGSKTIELWIGKSTAKVNGADIPIDAANPKVVPEIISSRTMLPLRFITENLGCDVQWDGTTKIITITYQAQ
jgi:outer membrane protein assembly factor BamB